MWVATARSELMTDAFGAVKSMTTSASLNKRRESLVIFIPCSLFDSEKVDISFPIKGLFGVSVPPDISHLLCFYTFG